MVGAAGRAAPDTIPLVVPASSPTDFGKADGETWTRWDRGAGAAVGPKLGYGIGTGPLGGGGTRGDGTDGPDATGAPRLAVTAGPRSAAALRVPAAGASVGP